MDRPTSSCPVIDDNSEKEQRNTDVSTVSRMTFHLLLTRKLDDRTRYQEQLGNVDCMRNVRPMQANGENVAYANVLTLASLGKSDL